MADMGATSNPSQSTPAATSSTPDLQHSRSEGPHQRGGRQRGSRGRGRGSHRGFGSKGLGEKNPSRERNERNPSKRGVKGERGRADWARDTAHKRKRNEDRQHDVDQPSKRQIIEKGDEASVAFTAEEIAAESRQPKRKVAVFIGYAGSGYKGMQVNKEEKTIEGDLFKAFIAAGAISKANADDPKKSSLVRCARTDKGVHAAGNMISLKLIIEDPDVVKKINENLPDQIRVWGIERTNGSFSCYQTCDSRWYEYLIPTYSFLPPQSQSFLGKKLVEVAENEGELENFKSRQADVADFWEQAEKEYVQPILDRLEPDIRANILATIFTPVEEEDQFPAASHQKPSQHDSPIEGDYVIIDQGEDGLPTESTTATATSVADADSAVENVQDNVEIREQESAMVDDITLSEPLSKTLSPFDLALKEVKAAYIKAKKAYRISDSRRQRVQEALSVYLGTRNFHNYTILKQFKDPSAKRVIRSFKVGKHPVIINDTEWLSLKVHGQSFMMHQIRKMVAMAALVVRCGADMKIIRDSYGPEKISIPKAPGLGLLLERPVFDSYNERAERDYQRQKLEFSKFDKEIEEFKQRQIYERIFREEEKDHQFHTFFNHVDHYRTDVFLWVTAAGIRASKQGLYTHKPVASGAKAREAPIDSDDEVDAGGEEG